MKVHEYRITNLNQVRAMKKTKKGIRNKNRDRGKNKRR